MAHGFLLLSKWNSSCSFYVINYTMVILKHTKKKSLNEERICIICNQKFYVKPLGTLTKQLGKGLRSRYSKTCSKQCAKLYYNNYKKINEKLSK